MDVGAWAEGALLKASTIQATVGRGRSGNVDIYFVVDDHDSRPGGVA